MLSKKSKKGEVNAAKPQNLVKLQAGKNSGNVSNILTVLQQILTFVVIQT